MKVHVRLFSTLSKYGPAEGGEFTLDMAKSATVETIPEILNMPAAVQRVILVNGRHAKGLKQLTDGDQVIIFPPLTGG